LVKYTIFPKKTEIALGCAMCKYLRSTWAKHAQSLGPQTLLLTYASQKLGAAAFCWSNHGQSRLQFLFLVFVLVSTLDG
jgi:hypothetical protein